MARISPSFASRKWLFAAIAAASMAGTALLPPSGQIATSPAPSASTETNPAAIEDCLVRNAIVPVDGSQAGEDAPPAIRTEYAYRTLQYELLLQLPDDLASVALLRGEHGMVDGLSVIRVDGASPVAELATPVIERLQHSPQELVDVRALVDAGTSPVSTRELCAAMAGIVDAVDEASTTTYVAINPESAGLVVGSEGPVEPYIEEIADSVQDRVQYIEDVRLAPAHRPPTLRWVPSRQICCSHSSSMSWQS